MARTKGSKNKPKATEQAPLFDFDKHNNITRAGVKVGKVAYIEGAFVAYVGQSVIQAFDLESIVEQLQAL